MFTLAVAIAAGAGFSSVGAAPAFQNPDHGPVSVPLDAKGTPVPFLVVVGGFKPGTLVYIEQCNSRRPGADGWAPSRDCDLGTSPAAALTDANGVARFDPSDANHAFHPFVGSSPQELFECRGGRAKKPGDTIDPAGCQLRVSTNNYVSTPDQVFLSLSFGGGGSSGGSSTGAIVVIVLAAVVVAIGAGVFVTRRNRTAARR